MANDYFAGFKILKHLDRIDELLKTGDTFPIMAEFDPTNSCTFNCPYCCDREINKDRKHFPKERFYTLVDELVKHGLKSVVVKGGGEPLICPHIVDYLKYIHAKNLDIGIISNGSYMTDEIVKTICETSTWIKISLDAGTSKVHTEMHRPIKGEAFDDVISNLKNLVSVRKTTKSKIVIGINFTLSEVNYKDLVVATEKVREIGIDYILIKYMIFEKRGVSSKAFTKVKTDTIKLIKQAQKLQTPEFKVIFRDLKDADKGWDKCLFNPLMTIITATGDVYPCCHTKGREGYVYGNVLDKSFLGMWKSKQRKQIHEKCTNKECLKYCSFRYTNHNRILNYMKNEQPHANFV